MSDDKKYFEENVKPITCRLKHKCNNAKCTNPESVHARIFNEGAKKQLETILEDYILIPRWKDGKRPS